MHGGSLIAYAAPLRPKRPRMDVTPVPARAFVDVPLSCIGTSMKQMTAFVPHYMNGDGGRHERRGWMSVYLEAGGQGSVIAGGRDWLALREREGERSRAMASIDLASARSPEKQPCIEPRPRSHTFTIQGTE